MYIIYEYYYLSIAASWLAFFALSCRYCLSIYYHRIYYRKYKFIVTILTELQAWF